MPAKRITIISLTTTLCVICSWISIPFTIPFTMQSFAVCYTLLILGAKDGLISILLYTLIGLIGLPVFSNFRGGIGHLLGPTGGYILGFIAMSLIYLLFEKIFKENIKGRALGLFLGMTVCYSIGTIWFYCFYNHSISFATIVSICVIPFIIPDIIKILLSIFLYMRTRDFITKKVAH